MTTARSRRRLLLAGSIVVVGAIATHIYLEANAANQLVACQQEYKMVQGGIDSYMAYFSVDVVQTPDAGGTSDMTSPVALYNKTPSASSPTYVRNSPTRWAYTWDATGRIKGIVPATGGPVVPAGCMLPRALRAALWGFSGTGIRHTPSTPDLGDLPARFAFGWTPRTGPFVGALHGTSNGHDWSWGFDQNTRNPYTPDNPQPDIGGSFSFSIDSITPGTAWTISIYYL
jgi:YD repeat-containing protein